MVKGACVGLLLTSLAGTALAQDYVVPGNVPQGYAPQGYAPQGNVQPGNIQQGYAPQGYASQGYAGQGYASQGGGGTDYSGSASIGSNEQLYSFDDQEKWKHGWLQEMPYYHGYHSFRPYNYHHVFGQSQTAAGAGLPTTMPYSQQWWHRYSQQANLNKSNQILSAPAPPGAYGVSSNDERARMERQLAELQQQLETQKQYHAGSTLGGTTVEQSSFGGASYSQPVFVNQVAPTAYQQTIPQQAIGPMYVSPNYPIETHATAPAAQKLELLRYMQSGGPVLPPR